MEPRAWGWLYFSLVRCIVLCSAFAVVSFVRTVGARLVLVLVLRVWCWLGSFAFGVGFGRSARAVVSSNFFLGSDPRNGRPSRN